MLLPLVCHQVLLILVPAMGEGGESLFSHLFLLLPTGLLEAGDDAHSSIYSQQLGFRQDAGLASFWVGESFEAQDGDKSWPKPQFF